MGPTLLVDNDDCDDDENRHGSSGDDENDHGSGDDDVNQVKMSVSTSTSVWWGTGAASTSATTLRGVIGVPAGVLSVNFEDDNENNNDVNVLQ